MHEMMDERLDGLLRWLRLDVGIEVAKLSSASADASFRRYFRVHSSDAQFIAMDAPPGQEDSEPFVRISGWFADLGLNSPRVLAADLEKGYLLLTDLGQRQYLQVLRESPQRAGELYGDALRTLDKLQHTGIKYQWQLPPYNSALLNSELALFRDWLCGTHLQLHLSPDELAEWHTTCDFLVESALAQPRVLVHRDYHSRNLMLCENDNPGVLDYQDAVNGPLTYDLVSLLKDCYIRLPEADVEAYAMGFHARARERLPAGFDEVAFMRAFELMGVQRHLKAAGIFCRLNHRDGKPAYLADIPRTLTYVSEVAARYRELDFLNSLLRERCLPALQVAA